MSFAGDIQSFARGTGIRMDKVLRKVIIDMTSDLVMMTPVDTGAARSNYFWGVDRVSAVDPSTVKNGAASINRAVSFAQDIKAGGVVYVTNNLPYIMRLEYGWSKQAPGGMARITVARWQKTVNAAVASVQ